MELWKTPAQSKLFRRSSPYSFLAFDHRGFLETPLLSHGLHGLHYTHFDIDEENEPKQQQRNKIE